MSITENQIQTVQDSPSPPPKMGGSVEEVEVIEYISLEKSNKLAIAKIGHPPFPPSLHPPEIWTLPQPHAKPKLTVMIIMAKVMMVKQQVPVESPEKADGRMTNFYCSLN